MKVFECFVTYPTIASFYVALHPKLEMQMTYNEDATGGMVKVFIDIGKIIMTTNVVIFLF